MTVQEIERRLTDLYRDGHWTGYGPKTSDHEPDCAGCAEAREVSHRWDDFWRDFEKRRLAQSR